jgi:hypothetical protein
MIGVGCGVVAQVEALREPLEGGRPWAGHWTYLTSLAILAALTSVLNARRPGSGAWALLMGLLVLVLLIPWLEGSGLARGTDPLHRLRLQAPWSHFYKLVLFVGLLNYAPTRYGAAALALGLGFLAELNALDGTPYPPAMRALWWPVVSALFALAIWLADLLSRFSIHAPPGAGRLWLWFRDHWGVVWALRMQERFNESARARGWSVRLTWLGFKTSPTLGATPTPAEVDATLQSVLRRFADPARIAAETGLPCDSPSSAGS